MNDLSLETFSTVSYIFSKNNGELLLHWKSCWVEARYIYADMTLAYDEWSKKWAIETAKRHECKIVKVISIRWREDERPHWYVVT